MSEDPIMQSKVSGFLVSHFGSFPYRVGEIRAELAQQIKADFEESFQGASAKVGKIVITVYT